MLTSTYVALMFALFAYQSDFSSLLGMQSVSAYLFSSIMVALLLPYVSISLYTNDKRIYLADASAHLYRPSAYYVAKVCTSRGLPVLMIRTAHHDSSTCVRTRAKHPWTAACQGQWGNGPHTSFAHVSCT